VREQAIEFCALIRADSGCRITTLHFPAFVLPHLPAV